MPHSTTQLSCDVRDRSFAAAKAPTNANDPAAPPSKAIDLPAMQPLTKLRCGNGIAWGEHVDWLPAFLDPPAAMVIAKIAGGVILLGVVALVVAKWKYAQVANWPKTSGRILSSEPGFELRQRFKTEQPRNERVAKIAYGFEAKGKTWRSNNILDSGYPPEDQVERLLADYPKGAAVTVFYNPSDPGKSALEIDHPPKELAAAAGRHRDCHRSGRDRHLDRQFGCRAVRRLVPERAAAGDASSRLPRIDVRARLLLCTPTRGGASPLASIRGQIVQSRVHKFEIKRDKPKRTLRGTKLMATRYMPVVEYTISWAAGSSPADRSGPIPKSPGRRTTRKASQRAIPRLGRHGPLRSRKAFQVSAGDRRLPGTGCCCSGQWSRWRSPRQHPGWCFDRTPTTALVRHPLAAPSR